MSEPTYPELLRSAAEKLCLTEVYDELIKQYPQFEYWTGSHNKMLHHYGRGGLVRHTWEIVEVGMHIIPTLNLCQKVDPGEFYLAALFHDTGKMFDYDFNRDEPDEKAWKPNDHRRLIYHVPRSSLIWHDVIVKFPHFMPVYHDRVLHAILAHHGRREHGSPVAPKTHVAWLVHLCDGISARMDDCDRIDSLKFTDPQKV